MDPDIISDEKVSALYHRITGMLIEKNLTITTMESCTCGLIASLITDTEGASAVFKGAHITYSNEAKILEGVPADIIDTYGVYSEETARAMAEAALSFFGADIAVGITGTTGNTDPANLGSTPGEIFYAIKTAEVMSSFHISVPPLKTRHVYKMAAAGYVADSLINIIGGS